MTRILGRFASIIRWAVLLVPNFIWFCLVLVVGRPAVERISSQENATQTQTLEGTTGDEDVLNNVPHEPLSTMLTAFKPATVASFVPADLPTDSPAGSGPVRGGLDTTTTTILYAETAPYPKLPCVHRYDGQTHPPGVSVPVPEEVENEGDPSNASLSPLEDQQDPNTSQIEPSEQPTFSGDDQLGDGLHSAVPCWGLDHIVGEESLCPRRSNPPLNLEMTVALGVVERAHELVRMFLTDKDQHSLQRAIHLLDHVIPLISHTALSAASLYIQARSRYLLFSQTRDPSLLDQSIETLRAVLDLKAWGVAERHETLVLCGDAFGARYQHRGDVDDLNRGIVSYREALDELANLGKNRSPSLLSHLAVLLLKRHSIRRDDSSDLDDAIDLYSEALVLSAANDPSRPLLLSHLATALLNRYHKLKNVSDVEEAIMYHRKALLFFTSNHPNRTFSLNNLASALLARYNRLRQICDVEEVIACSREALSVSIDNPLYRASSLHNLASALLSRYCTLASVSDVEEAIVCSRDALLLRPDHHPDRPYTTNNLTNALLARYGRLGRIADLEETITHSREALLLYTGGHHPNRPTTLNILGNALYFRYTKLRHIPNLDESIVLLREALSLLPDNHSSRPMHLNNLANALITRYRTLENTSDLGEAIVYSREALSLRSDGHADRPLSLDNLATALLGRYDQLKHVSDLEGAILHYQEALSLRPGDHPHRPSSLNNLAAALLARYNQLGHTPDLEETVIHLREALSLPNGNHADRPSTLNNFINALLIRSGSISNLEEGIMLAKEALFMCHTDDPARSEYIFNLANLVYTRYEGMGDVGSQDEAICLYGEALSLRPGNHHGRAATLQSLGIALLARDRDESDRVVGMGYIEESLSLLPSHSPIRQTAIINLLLLSHRMKHSTIDWTTLRDRCIEVAKLTPPEHPSYSRMALLIAPILHTWGEGVSELLTAIGLDPDLNAEDATLALLQSGSQSVASPSIYQLQATCAWVELSQEFGRPCSLEMYHLMLQHLDLSVAYGSSLDIRRQQLTTHAVLLQARNMVSGAVAFAIEQGAVETAIEFLERGRSILLAQLSLYRAASGLETVAPELARRFYDLSWQAESATLTEAQASPDTETTLPFEDPISRSDRLRRQWEAAVDEIREVEGFENFLRPMPFADLQKAAAQGPVILINIDRMRSDAIIVTSQHQPIVVPLPSATPERVEALVGLFQGVAKSLPKSNAYDSLRSLWEDFGEPIVSALEGIPDVPKGSRIWWCPTGAVTALPLHAAGNYYARGKRLPDLYVSSYTPTLSALSRARQVRLQRSGVPSILAIGQSRTPNLRPLPAVPEELARVKGRMPHMTAIEDEHGTCDAVLSTVRQHRWIHLACHGIVRPENPLQSHFALHNGPLSLFQLMQIRLPDAELAFLSCCHSASGNSNIPDEFLHLAAGMQFSGFKSVVATMWAMNDAVGPTLADEFYRVLLGRKGKGDYRNSAKALSDALKILRREGIPLEVWINF
ncbi:hypothetical protein FRB99_008359, partial [Tulasnella sp. 403]